MCRSEDTSQADFYKLLKNQGFTMTAQEHAHQCGTTNPDGWIRFKDGSRYNTANNQTINPGDIVI